MYSSFNIQLYPQHYSRQLHSSTYTTFCVVRCRLFLWYLGAYVLEFARFTLQLSFTTASSNGANPQMSYNSSQSHSHTTSHNQEFLQRQTVFPPLLHQAPLQKLLLLPEGTYPPRCIWPAVECKLTLNRVVHVVVWVLKGIGGSTSYILGRGWFGRWSQAILSKTTSRKPFFPSSTC